MPKIYLIDVTNRDGVQTARLGLAKLEKTLINIYLNDMGVFQSEFGRTALKWGNLIGVPLLFIGIGALRVLGRRRRAERRWEEAMS